MMHRGPNRRSRLHRAIAGAGALACVGLAAFAGPAHADGEGSIDHVQPGASKIQVLFSVPGVGKSADVDLSSVVVSIDGTQVEATAAPAGKSGQSIRRTSILAIDTSNSMRGDRFTEAKRAAVSFLDTVPSDVYVGIVSFAGDVTVDQSPTLDRGASKLVLDGLTLSQHTKLYDGVLTAVSASGESGARSVLVLSDGRDTSPTKLDQVTEAVTAAGVKVDVVALEQSDKPALTPLAAIAASGEGRVLSAKDPKALSEAFLSEADALARQLVVTAVVPDTQVANEADLSVSVDSAGQTYADEAFVPVRSSASLAKRARAAQVPMAAPTGGYSVPVPLMIAALVAAGLGIGYLLLNQLMTLGGHAKKLTIVDRVSAYSLENGGRDPRITTSAGVATAGGDPPKQKPTAQSVGSQAKDVAKKALANNRGLEDRIATRLDGAGMSVKPAEWLLMHVGIAFLAGLGGLLLSSGGILLTLLFLVLGTVLPWVYLGLKRSRRLAKFNSQLADTLQLMAGSLSAGLSLAQSVDTIEREGSDPIAGEFRRALVETRLGVPIEDGLESIAERMESRDFEWVVMAIRIQREVGGNLAELLLSVAATMREREYLRRQVRSLSAEGRLSCYILGGLPPVFLLYLVLSKPDYVSPMFSTPIGWLMVAGMGVLLSIGIFWMSRVVKVEV